MTERYVTERLMEQFKQLPEWEVIKHADKFTSGIPDMSVSGNGRTSWLELKLLKRGELAVNAVEPAQRITCCRLERATGGRCWVIVYRASRWEDSTTIYRPSQLNVPEPPESLPHVQQSSTMIFETTRRLWHEGVIRWAGHRHDLVRAMVQHTHS